MVESSLRVLTQQLSMSMMMVPSYPPPPSPIHPFVHPGFHQSHQSPLDQHSMMIQQQQQQQQQQFKFPVTPKVPLPAQSSPSVTQPDPLTPTSSQIVTPSVSFPAQTSPSAAQDPVSAPSPQDVAGSGPITPDQMWNLFQSFMKGNK